MPRLAKIDSCPLKRSFSYLILTVALRDRPPAPTRRTPRRIAKRRIDKAARRDNGRPFRVAVPSKLPIPVCVGARPVQLLDERSSAIKLSKIPRRGARPPGRSVPVRDYNPSDRDRSIWRKYKSPARRAWARRAYAKLLPRPMLIKGRDAASHLVNSWRHSVRGCRTGSMRRASGGSARGRCPSLVSRRSRSNQRAFVATRPRPMARASESLIGSGTECPRIMFTGSEFPTSGANSSDPAQDSQASD